MSHTYTGQITIEPPLNWAQIRTVTKGIQSAIAKNAGGSRYTKDSIAKAEPDGVRDIMGFGLLIAETTRDTEDGTLLVKSAAALTYYGDEGCMYLNEADIISLVVKVAPGSKLNGVLVMVHEEGTQGTKTTVKDNKVSATSGIAYMRWADGTEDRVSQII